MGKQSRTEQKLIELLNAPENSNRCGECGSTYPTWASCNLGIFLCGRCASVHRKLGRDISQVKSLSLDKWGDSDVSKLERMGNRRAKSIWNPKKEPFPFTADDDINSVETFLRLKYIDGKFRYDSIDPDEYFGHNGRNSYDDYDQDEENDRFRRSRPSTVSSSKYSSRSRSRHSRYSRPASSRAIRLTHMPPSVEEKRRFYATSYRISRDMGLDQDLLIEALVLANGDSNLAVEAVLLDTETSKSDEPAPPLPRRRENLLSSDKTGMPSTVSGQDWMSSSPPPQTGFQQTQPTGFQAQQQQPSNLQPFLDQATGMVVYVDSVTGQQYLDTNSMQQAPQQTGVDKSTIMSLYQRPDLFTSPVAVTEEQKQAIQQQLQQQQLQLQLQLQQLQMQQLTQQQLQQLPMAQQQQYLMQQQQMQQQMLQQQMMQQQQGYWR